MQLSLTSAIDGGNWLTSRSGRHTSVKETRFHLNRRLGGLQSRFGSFEKEKRPCLCRKAIKFYL